MLGIRPQGRRCVDGGGGRRAVGGLRVGVALCECLLLRLGGGGGGVSALAGTAACLCAGAGLFHLPPLGERGLVHCLQAEPFPLTFVKRLPDKDKGLTRLLTPIFVPWSG